MDTNRNFLMLKIHPVIKPMVTQLLKQKPIDPVGFMIKWLEQVQNNSIACSGKSVAKHHKCQSQGHQLLQSVCTEADVQFVHKEGSKYEGMQKTGKQISLIKEKLKASCMFDSLNDKDMDNVINAIEKKEFGSGELVFSQGEEGDSLYIVEKGAFSCYKVYTEGKKPRFIKDYKPGEAFGELALISNSPREATIQSKTDSVAYCLDKKIFNNVVKDALIRKRKKYEKFLQSLKILNRVDPYEITRVIDAIRLRKFRAGDTILRQGEESNVFLLLENGTAFSLSESQPIQKEIIYEKGAYFGELALLAGAVQSVSVFAKTDCVCLILDPSKYRRLLGPMAETLKRDLEQSEQSKKE